MSRYKTLPDLLKLRANEHPDDVAHWILDADDTWHPISNIEFYRKVMGLSGKLQALGINTGQVVAIMATTSHVWESLHHAFLSLGGIVVGIDPNENSEQLNAIIKIANVKILAIDQIKYLDKFNDLSQFDNIVAFNSDPSRYQQDKIKYLDIPETANGELNDTPQPEILKPSDIATIVFTSGTTGTPKGIAYRHDQIIAAIDSILLTYPELNDKPCHLVCWLPLSNLFQRIVNLCALAGGAEVYFVEQPHKIIEYLPAINPHIFIAVPRFYEKLYQGFEAKLNLQPRLISLCLKYSLKMGESPSTIGSLFRAANRQVFKSFTSLFGENIRYMVSGSAAMPVWLLHRYQSLGLLILEAYGLSENVVPIAANRSSEYRFGTVGKALPGNTINLADDDELLVKGIGVFNGYLDDQPTKQSTNESEFLPTGDYAKIDAQGFISLTGRKSEVFKTSTGRKIAPVAIESVLQSNVAIEHAVVFGENRKFLVALVTVGNSNTIEDQSRTTYAKKIAIDLTATTLGLPEYKRPVGIIFSYKPLSVAEQELTTNLKLRRKNIRHKYEKWIEELYNLLEEPESTIHSQPISASRDIVLLKL
ncbi:long-chain fatty acid--CoA ligase [Methylomonas sp. ZR1]|uniref:AMP-dependent synthetase/ligase n=1 Tax=Methylomonas sp. ZR1 TaxID=1797072 RepID=UPI001490D029|nr:AMP-binding protein [Methylomonas sp. ZR1]NOV28433.1 long-chain fatty acid--CoA ligase [Methylomonas sp. ZR1]